MMNLFKKNEKSDEKQDVIQEKSLKKYNKLKLSDKISLKMRKRMFVSNVFTFFIVLDLIIAFIGINLIVDYFDIKDIDVTASKLYTLSEESKEVLKDINQDVKIYIYGIEEEGNILIDFLNQYNDANERITYEVLTEENNMDKVKEFELTNGNVNVIVESGESRKIFSSADFSSYDYATGDSIDLTEEVLTNAVLAMVPANQSKVYFSTGHGEYDLTEGIATLGSYLKYESLDCESINMLTNGGIPEDCKALAIVSPMSDLFDPEVQYLNDYINRGGNLFIAQDILSEKIKMDNLQKVLDLYGVKISDEIIKENSSNDVLPGSNNIFRPQASASNPMTTDINSSNQGMILAYVRKLDIASDEELESLNVTREDLLTTSESAQSANVFENSAQYGENQQLVIASLLTKKVGEKEQSESDEENSEEKNDSEENEISSKLIIAGNAAFLSDFSIKQVSEYYPLFMIGNNKDFALNTLENLSEKEAQLKIRKSIATSSYAYTATISQRIIVIIAISILPILIIVAGIIVGVYRKKRK